jgi:hypothetical protein
MCRQPLPVTPSRSAPALHHDLLAWTDELHARRPQGRALEPEELEAIRLQVEQFDTIPRKPVVGRLAAWIANDEWPYFTTALSMLSASSCPQTAPRRAQSA